MGKKVIAVRIERCMACRSCELACAAAHSAAGDFAGALLAGEKPGYRMAVEAAGGYHVPVHCHHCEDAPCMSVCPTGAIHREAEDGPVLFNGDYCIGCRMCVEACPFGMITVNSRGGGVLKCDLCIERLAAGREPACVEACPTGALVFTEEADEVRGKRKRTAERMVEGMEETSRA